MIYRSFICALLLFVAPAAAFLQSDASQRASSGGSALRMAAAEEGAPAVGRRDFFAGAAALGLGAGLMDALPAAAAPAPAKEAALKGYGDRLRRIARTLDELQRDIFNEDWEFVATYPATFRAFVPVFTRYTDARFEGEGEADRQSRVALRYEVGRLFGAVERLKRAAEKKDPREAQAAFAQISVAYDRYLKAGYLYDAYDPVTSTEKFFADVPDSALRFAPPAADPPKIKDLVLLTAGPDKGKTGTLIGLEETLGSKGEKKKSGIVKLDNTIGRVSKIREIKVVPYAIVAKRLDTEGERDAVFSIKK
uniref:Uncharacterized protein n=1 Tax=Heterosigma akashiwo TaxID=2829 RepID=A0A7S3Y3I2_HETAK